MLKSFSFVQSKNEIRFILKKMKKSIIFIPLNLDSMIYLKEKKIKFINPLHLFNNQNHKKAISFTEKFISNLKYGEIKYEGLKLEYRSQIRFIINSCIFLIELFKKISKNKKISIVLSGWHGVNLKKYGSNEIFLSSLIIKYCINFKNLLTLTTDFQEFSTPKKVYTYKINLSKVMKDSILINALGYNFFRILIFKKLFQKVYHINFRGNKINYLKKILLFILGYREIVPQKKIGSKFKMIQIPDILLFYEKFDLSKIINIRKKELSFELYDIKQQLIALKKFFKKNNFSYYFSFLSRGLDGSISELLQNSSCKTVNISHGTVTEFYNKYDALYKKIISDSVFTGCFKFFAVQSQICKRSLINTNSKIKNTLETGNLIFSDVKNNISNQKYLLYAVTLKKFHGLQFFGVEMYYEFIENLILLNKISNKERKFIVNLHESHANLVNEMKALFPNLIFTSEKINKVLKKSYALISFSSTAIEDALASNRYIILFDQWKRYEHFKIKSKCNVKKIYYVNNKSQLINTIDRVKILKNKADFNIYNLKDNFNKLFDYKDEY